MTDNLDLSEFLRQHQAKLADEFRNPDATSFSKHYGIPLPEQLSRLYALRESLMKTPIEIATTHGTIYIQHFTPLTDAIVNQGARYDWKFFVFASDWDGHSLLYSVAQPNIVYVDYSMDEPDIEETTIEFESFLAGLEQSIAMA